MGDRLKVLLVAGLSVFAARPAPAAERGSPLAADEAAVVGGWRAKGEDVQGMVLQPLAEDGGCLKLVDHPLVLPDHQTVDTAVIQGAYRLKPGRYALAGVRWVAPYYDQYDWGGLSRPAGDLWVVTLAPGVVTDLGVWTITSPYPHRYVLGEANLKAGVGAAQKAADGLGPLVMAAWVRAPVSRSNAACPAPTAP